MADYIYREIWLTENRRVEPIGTSENNLMPIWLKVMDASLGNVAAEVYALNSNGSYTKNKNPSPVSGNIVKITPDNGLFLAGHDQLQVHFPIANGSYITMLIPVDCAPDLSNGGAIPAADTVKPLVVRAEQAAEAAEQAAQRVVPDVVYQWMADHPAERVLLEDHTVTARKLAIDALGFVTPEQFGAKGDGRTNDAAAFVSMFECGVNVFVLQPKTYLIQNTASQRLILPHGAKLNMNGATIDVVGSNGNKYNFTNYGLTGEYASKTKYDGNGNISIYDGTFLHDANFIVMHCDGLTVERCTFRDMNTAHAFQLGGCKNVVFRDCEFVGQRIPTSDSGSASTWEVINIEAASHTCQPYFSNASAATYDYTLTQYVLVEHCKFAPDTASGYNYMGDGVGTHYVDEYNKNYTGSDIDKKAFRDITVRNCWFESANATNNFSANSGYDMLVALWVDCTIENNFFRNNSSGGRIIRIAADNCDCDNLRLVNNTWDCATGALNFKSGNCTNMILVGNRYHNNSREYWRCATYNSTTDLETQGSITFSETDGISPTEEDRSNNSVVNLFKHFEAGVFDSFVAYVNSSSLAYQRVELASQPRQNISSVRYTPFQIAMLKSNNTLDTIRDCILLYSGSAHNVQILTADAKPLTDVFIHDLIGKKGHPI